MATTRIHFFCYPKPWTSEFKHLQTTAVQSWLALGTVYLLGSEEDTPELGFAVHHVPNIECNEFGTPLVSSIFATIASSPLESDSIICYVNADIVLGEDFLVTVRAVAEHMRDREDWLIVGKRTDTDIVFSEKESKTTAQIMREARERGKDHGWDGIDYFVYKRPNMFAFVYPFALGKFVWDQWLLGNAFRRGIPTIDASRTIFAVHLNSRWLLKGIATNDRQLVHDSEESKRNRSFDYYQKTILTGTTHATATDAAGLITVIPRPGLE